ncbi:hypothetical protein FA95DRAFT_1605769 [Auriscalpium vulgare]|uniref:Uncharacterized protein n=1 Tax=Auriscalpium vulgare TaxID=40419 RepID=A0ACB8RW34_9AGAM|nr:hypothetical protein FA95DRAFT_1605769 [Auriscalpium vulgare]
MAERNTGRPWTTPEDDLLRHAVETAGENADWKTIALRVPGRTNKACRKRWLHSLAPNVRKVQWTTEEDDKLKKLYAIHGTKWSVIARGIPGRTDDACSKRYREALDPALISAGWTDAEDAQLLALHARFGGKWVQVGKELRRSSLGCRNRWRLLQRKEASIARAGAADWLSYTTQAQPPAGPPPPPPPPPSSSSWNGIDVNDSALWDMGLATADLSNRILARPQTPPLAPLPEDVLSLHELTMQYPASVDVPMPDLRPQELPPQRRPDYAMPTPPSNRDLAFEAIPPATGLAADGRHTPSHSVALAYQQLPDLTITYAHYEEAFQHPHEPTPASHEQDVDRRAQPSLSPSPLHAPPSSPLSVLTPLSSPPMAFAALSSTLDSLLLPASPIPPEPTELPEQPPQSQSQQSSETSASRPRSKPGDHDGPPPRLSSTLAASSDPSVLGYACGDPQCWEKTTAADGARYATSKELSEHVRDAHAAGDLPPDYRPYRCGLQGCGKAWKSVNGLQYHLQVSKAHFLQAITSLSATDSNNDTPGDGDRASSIDSAPPPPKKAKKLHPCPRPNCLHVYKQLSGLRYHLSHGHSNEVPAQLDSVPPTLARKVAEKLQREGSGR